MSIGQESGAAEERTAQSLAGFHRLHGEVGTHGFGNRVDVFTSLETLLGQKLDLGTSFQGSATIPRDATSGVGISHLF